MNSFPNYIVDSLYDFHILRWRSLFPESDILIVSLHDIEKNPRKVMAKIERFLGLSHFNFEEIVEKHHNVNEVIAPYYIPSGPAPFLAQFFRNTVKNTKLLTGIELSLSLEFTKKGRSEFMLVMMGVLLTLCIPAIFLAFASSTTTLPPLRNFSHRTRVS
jgi:hypothetical protein